MTSRTVFWFAFAILALSTVPVLGQGKLGTTKICKGVDVPEGFVIVAAVTSSVCPNGAFLIKKESANNSQKGAVTSPTTATPTQPQTSRFRLRRAGDGAWATEATPVEEKKQPPALLNASPAVELDAEVKPAAYVSAPEDVGANEVVRVDTTLVTVPVSVLDHDGRFVPELKRDDFHIFENGEEQTLTYFEGTESPFTVALMLDTSASTSFKLEQIKEAAIRFAGQLRPQDRVLVVTFNDQVLLLAEATNDRVVIKDVIENRANTGDNTRLYDAIDLLVKKRLNRMPGRKAIVLFTDGVDTASSRATYDGTMYMAEELDTLIYPIQYDTFDDMKAGGSLGTFALNLRKEEEMAGIRPSVRPGGSIESPEDVSDRVMRELYGRANLYLHGLADKTGGRLYRANDPAELARAFALIAEELGQQYSLGYYPKSPRLAASERRLLKVRLDRQGLVVRARDSYIATGKPVAKGSP